MLNTITPTVFSRTLNITPTVFHRTLNVEGQRP